MLGVMYSPALNPVRAMDLLILAWCLALLPAGCISAEETAIGCMQWVPHETTDVCCVHCKPGNRVVSRCGPDPQKLCTPCEKGTYTKDPLKFDCQPCTQCTGALILKKRCTTTKDTECDCIAGYKCGDEGCSFCVEVCGKGKEPKNRSCQNCPQGTFNDQIHQKCKPWATRCPHPNQHIVASGDAVSDIKCSTSESNHSDPVVVTLPSRNTGNSFVPENTDNTGWVVAVTCAGFLVIVISIISSIIMLYKLVQKKLPPKTLNPFGPIIRNPTTDEPQTLVSCSCHQPQQEQGSSTESLTSQESKAPLLNEIRLDQTP